MSYRTPALVFAPRNHGKTSPCPIPSSPGHGRTPTAPSRAENGRAYALVPYAPAEGSPSLRVICIYSTVDSGGEARHRIRSGLGSVAPDAALSIEFFSFTVLQHGVVCWASICSGGGPDILVIAGDREQRLHDGVRQSIERLMHHSTAGMLLVLSHPSGKPSPNAGEFSRFLITLSRRHRCMLHEIQDGPGGRAG